MKKKILMLSVVLLTLSGCSTPAEKEAEQTRIVNASITDREEARKNQYCADMGAPEGSHKYSECRFNLDELVAARAKMGMPVTETWWDHQKTSAQ